MYNHSAQEYEFKGYSHDKAKSIWESYKVLESIGARTLKAVFGADNRYLEFNEDTFSIKNRFQPDTVLEQFSALLEIAQLPETERTIAMKLIHEAQYCPSFALKKLTRDKKKEVEFQRQTNQTIAATLNPTA